MDSDERANDTERCGRWHILSQVADAMYVMALCLENINRCTCIFTGARAHSSWRESGVLNAHVDCGSGMPIDRGIRPSVVWKHSVNFTTTRLSGCQSDAIVDDGIPIVVLWRWIFKSVLSHCCYSWREIFWMPWRLPVLRNLCVNWELANPLWNYQSQCQSHAYRWMSDKWRTTVKKSSHLVCKRQSGGSQLLSPIFYGRESGLASEEKMRNFWVEVGYCEIRYQYW